MLRIRRLSGKQEIVVERAKPHSDHKPNVGQTLSSPVKKFIVEKIADKTAKRIQDEIQVCSLVVYVISTLVIF